MLIMGVVNLTPDSFSDGGLFFDSLKAFDPAKAVKQALELVAAGADIVDLGAESTRPGALSVPAELEWERLEPVLKELLLCLPAHVRLSVDTRKALIMRKAVELGVPIINCVGGLVDRETLRYIAQKPGTSYMAMHMHLQPEAMQLAPLGKKAAFAAVTSFFQQSYDTLRHCGFSHDRIWMDPGIGFGKTDPANLWLMGQTSFFAARYQLAIGVSRKSWLGRLLGLPEAKERDKPSKVAEAALFMAGAKLIRTHDVGGLQAFRQVLTQADDERDT